MAKYKRKQRSLLTLNAHNRRKIRTKANTKQRQDKPMLWTNTFDEVFGKYARDKPTPMKLSPPKLKQFLSPSSLKKSRNKRSGSSSPYLSLKSPIKFTPSKPSGKRMRRCLFTQTTNTNSPKKIFNESNDSPIVCENDETKELLSDVLVKLEKNWVQARVCGLFETLTCWNISA